MDCIVPFRYGSGCAYGHVLFPFETCVPCWDNPTKWSNHRWRVCPRQAEIHRTTSADSHWSWKGWVGGAATSHLGMFRVSGLRSDPTRFRTACTSCHACLPHHEHLVQPSFRYEIWIRSRCQTNVPSTRSSHGILQLLSLCCGTSKRLHPWLSIGRPSTGSRSGTLPGSVARTTLGKVGL